jgi:adenosylmethionine-8-amino-7-oxononanoate aminotransferase
MHGIGTHIVLEGEGCSFRDESGRRIRDGLPGLWGVSVGHGCEAFAEAVSEQIARNTVLSIVIQFEPAIHVAKFLADKAPSRIKRTIF